MGKGAQVGQPGSGAKTAAAAAASAAKKNGLKVFFAGKSAIEWVESDTNPRHAVPRVQRTFEEPMLAPDGSGRRISFPTTPSEVRTSKRVDPRKVPKGAAAHPTLVVFNKYGLRHNTPAGVSVDQMTVGQFKAAVLEGGFKLGHRQEVAKAGTAVGPDDCMLLFHGKILRDDAKTLADEGIPRGCDEGLFLVLAAGMVRGSFPDYGEPGTIVTPTMADVAELVPCDESRLNFDECGYAGDDDLIQTLPSQDPAKLREMAKEEGERYIRAQKEGHYFADDDHKYLVTPAYTYGAA